MLTGLRCRFVFFFRVIESGTVFQPLNAAPVYREASMRNIYQNLSIKQNKIKNFLRTCLDKVTKKGIKKVFLSNGYSFFCC